MLRKALATAVGAPVAAAMLCCLALAGPRLAVIAGPAGGPGAADPGRIPDGMVVLYRRAASTCRGLPWEVLAGIGKVETDHGRDTRISPAGARGPMQFMPATWAEYGVDVRGTGVPDIEDPADAVFAAARLLCANGASAPQGVPAAVFAYNHSTLYVEDVLGWAASYTRSYGGTPVPAVP